MVVEKVELVVSAGREEECLKFVADNRDVIGKAPGCRSFIFGRGVENPSKVFFVVGWDSLEAHKAATQRPEQMEFSKTLVGFVTGAGAEHFVVAD